MGKTTSTIQIGLYEIKAGVKNLTTVERLNEIGTANILLDASKAEPYKMANLKDQIVILIEKDAKKKIIFIGVIDETSLSEKTITLECKGFAQKLADKKITALFKDMTQQYIMYYLVKTAGLNVGNIPGLKLNEEKRLYTIIVPIPNLSIPEPRALGKVTFYKNDVDNSDEKELKSMDAEKFDEVWKKENTRAKVSVLAMDFLEAFDIGLHRVSRALDWLSFRTNLSTAFFPSGDQQIPLIWKRKNSLSIASESNWIYARDNITNERWLHNYQEYLLDEVLEIGKDDDEYFSQTLDNFGDLLTRKEGALLDNERSILSSLHWLRRARQTGKNDDKLLDLFTALEFLLKGETQEKLFNDDDMKRIKSKIKEIEFEEDEVATNGGKTKKGKRLSEKIGELNDPPFSIKIEKFIETYKLPFSKGVEYSEEAILKKLRIKRNHLEHGRGGIEVDNAELNTLGHIVEKMIVYKLNDMRN